MARLRSPRTLLPLKLFVIFLLAFPLSVLASDGQQANAPSPIPDPNASAKDLEERGDVLRAQKRYLDALDFYAAAIAKHPTALLWNKEGMSYLFLQKYPLLQESPGIATQRCRIPLQPGKFVLGEAPV
jgi:tetratricopeptide (TPR) repeat protein